jgi:hypothetical protein
MAVGQTYKPVGKGQAVTANSTNANARAVQRGQTYSGNVNRRNFQEGVAVDFPQNGSVAGSSVYQKLAQIEAIYDDYYEVVTYNPVADSTTGATYGAAKPYNQQITIFPEATEAHEVGDIILILKATSNVSVDGAYLGWIEAGSGGGGSTIKSADNKTALTAILSEGELGYTTGTTKRGYWRINSTTVCVTHLE